MSSVATIDPASGVAFYIRKKRLLPALIDCPGFLSFYRFGRDRIIAFQGIAKQKYYKLLLHRTKRWLPLFRLETEEMKTVAGTKRTDTDSVANVPAVTNWNGEDCTSKRSVAHTIPQLADGLRFQRGQKQHKNQHQIDRMLLPTTPIKTLPPLQRTERGPEPDKEPPSKRELMRSVQKSCGAQESAVPIEEDRRTRSRLR